MIFTRPCYATLISTFLDRDIDSSCRRISFLHSQRIQITQLCKSEKIIYTIPSILPFPEVCDLINSFQVQFSELHQILLHRPLHKLELSPWFWSIVTFAKPLEPRLELSLNL